MADQVHYSFPIVKFDRTPDGDLIVYGKCTDGTVDADHQIVDPEWSASALTKWLQTGANMRVQHSPFLYPAGKGLALDLDKDGDTGHWLKALVVKDTPAHALVEKRILKDFSIGILDPRVVHDRVQAPGGRICGGEIGEVSLVDRGSNKNTEFQIAKSAGNGGVELVAKMLTMSPMAHMALTGKRKGKIRDSGGRDVSGVPGKDFAGPGHTFPIKTPDDVSDAASLAHHAADPGEVRHDIADIAERKFGMHDEELPPSLAGKDGGTCPTCKGKGKIRGGKVDCPDCVAKVATVVKGDAGEDYPGDQDTDSETTADYNADSGGDEDDGPPKKAKKSAADRAFARLLKAQRKALKNAARGDNGGRTPASVEGHPDPDAAEDGPSKVEDKTMIPAGHHREPDGGQAEDIEEDAGMHSSDEGGDRTGVPGSDWSANKSSPSYGMQRLHDAVCPHFQWKDVRKAYGLPKDVGAAAPVRELQTLAIEALEKGHPDEAQYFTEILQLVDGIKAIGPDVLLDARKAFPEFFPDTHPSQRQDVRPGQFQRGYLSGGRPSLSAGSESGHPSLPAAHVHEVSAQDFRRGYLSGGRASASPGEGTQASHTTAAFGTALNTLSQLHQRVSSMWPGMCPVNVELHDYTTGEGQTGIRPGHAPAIPATIGESATGKTAGAAEPRLRKALSKSQRRIKALEAEVALLGAMPDPEQAPYRGLPQLAGPVDRESFFGKALGAGGPDAEATEDDEFLAFVNGLAANGDPAMRLNATKAIRGLLTK